MTQETGMRPETAAYPMSDAERRCCLLSVACALEGLANSEACRERMIDVLLGVRMSVDALLKQWKDATP